MVKRPEWRPSASTLLVMMIALQVVFFVFAVWVGLAVSHQAGIDCKDREDARNGVRRLGLLVTTPQDYNGDGTIDYVPNLENPFIAQLVEDLKPGGALEPVKC